MKTGRALIGIVPLREEPAHRSQQVSQLLFGETYTVLEEQRDWLLIRCTHDGYEGWMPANQFAENVSGLNYAINTQLITMVRCDDEIFPVSLGALVPHDTWLVDGKKYSVAEQIPAILEDHLSAIQHYSRLCIHAPYLWGGRSPLGIDCSGFTQLIYRLLGKSVKRDAWQQADEGVTVNFVNESRPGDLAFFDNEEGRITHVGIILNNHQIIHASGRVRIDQLDHEGIYDPGTQKYTHKLRIIRRYF